MAQRNTSTLINLIQNGRLSMNDLTRKERKAVEKSLSVSKEVREFQSQSQINKNDYEVLDTPKPKNLIKAEKIGLDWSFSQQGFTDFIEQIERTFEGRKKEFNGYIIYKSNDREAVLIEV